MRIRRVLLTLLPLLCVCACSGGGGSPPPPPVAAWDKFRHDVNNSGQGTGSIAENNGMIKWQTSIDGTPISASPAIDVNGTIYIATEGGTLAALAPTTGAIKWTVGGTTPVECPAGTQTLGPLISSPAVYAFNSATNIFIGSASGAAYFFQDNGTTRTCVASFQPSPCDFQSPPCKAPTPSAVTIVSRFISSPAFTVNSATGAVAGVFIGAAVDVTRGSTTRTVGRLYAINSNGTLIWQYPRAGARDIGAITSSPAVGEANTLLFTAADSSLGTSQDTLYSLTSDGSLLWSFPIGTLSDSRAPFTASPLIVNSVFAPTADGQIFAVNPDGSFRWRAASPDGAGFLSSLTTGVPATTTPSLTPTLPPTPTPPPGATVTPTPTATPVPLVQSIFGITVSGTVVLIDSNTGHLQMLTGPVETIAGPVISSPLLSLDSFLVVGDADGKLHAINTATGAPPSSTWPVQLAPPGKRIRSSPSIDGNGVVYVGADDGFIYAVGTQ